MSKEDRIKVAAAMFVSALFCLVTVGAALWTGRYALAAMAFAIYASCAYQSARLYAGK